MNKYCVNLVKAFVCLRDHAIIMITGVAAGPNSSETKLILT